MASRAHRSTFAVVLACAISCISWLAAGDAEAYCRTTTCDPKVEQCPIDANGCTRAGAPLTWRSVPIVYRFHGKSSDRLDRDNAREAVRAAFQRWSDVTCTAGRTSLRFAEEEDIDAKRPRDPHVRGADHFGIYFRDDAWTATDPDSTLALTTQTFGKINGWVEQADIEINTTSAAFATSDSATGIDLQAVLTHEVGHYIGLAHSPHPDSIMVDSYCKSGTRCGKGKVEARRLGADDEAAICALFPPSGPSGVLYEDPEAASCAAAQGGQARSAHGSWLPFAGGAFVLAALRRRRSRQ